MNKYNLIKKITHPNDCSLLIALPLDYDSFKKDVKMSMPVIPARYARGDYAFKMVNALSKTNVEKAWDKYGSVVASLCRDLISDAKSVGVMIYENATRERLIQITEAGTPVLVIVAHWRGSRVLAADIRIDEFWNSLTAIKKSSDRFERNIFERLESLVSDTTLVPKASVLADSISSAICMEAGYQNPKPDDNYMNDPERLIAIGRIRDRVDTLFPNFLVPGNCLELRDGYHKASEIAGMFHKHWSGIVELAVCHSVYLAEAIKSGRDNCRVITNEQAKHPERCIQELRETFLSLSLGNQNYIKLRLKIFADYSQMLMDFD